MNEFNVMGSYTAQNGDEIKVGWPNFEIRKVQIEDSKESICTKFYLSDKGYFYFVYHVTMEDIYFVDVKIL